MSVLGTKSRYKVVARSAEGQRLLMGPELSIASRSIANVYSLKTKTVAAGRLVLGDWLGRNRVFTGVGLFA